MEQNSLIFDHNIVNMFYQYLLGEAKEFPGYKLYVFCRMMESSLYIEWHLTILLSTWVYFWHNMPEMHCIAWTYKIRDLANLVKIKIGIVIFGKSDALAAYIQFVLGIRYRYKSTFSERVSVYTGIYFVISSSQPSYLDLHKSHPLESTVPLMNCTSQP